MSDDEIRALRARAVCAENMIGPEAGPIPANVSTRGLIALADEALRRGEEIARQQRLLGADLTCPRCHYVSLQEASAGPDKGGLYEVECGVCEARERIAIDGGAKARAVLGDK